MESILNGPTRYQAPAVPRAVAVDNQADRSIPANAHSWHTVFAAARPTPTTVAFHAVQLDVPKKATVPVSTFGSTVVSTVLLPWLVGRRLFQLLWPPPSRTPSVVLRPSFSGHAEPGEMVLVASAMPTECTQFLSAIVRHVSASASGYAVLCSADDVHPHVLTVEQLLRFRLRARAVRSRRDEDDAVELLLDSFRLEPIRHSLIGNAFIRGISGGERRRLSVAEALLSGANVLCFDDLTRGLDSATALQCVRCLRSVARAYRLTIFVSLSAASDTVYASFDQLVAIRDGRQAFCGTPVAVQTAFPAAATAVPTGASHFEQLYACIGPHSESMTTEAILQRSSLHYSVEAAGDLAISRAEAGAEAEAHYQRLASVVRHRLRLWAARVVALLQRQLLLAWKDRFTVAVSWSLFLVLGLTLGVSCFQLQHTAAGAEARAGLLYTCVLAIAVSAQVEVAKTSLGRPLLRKVFSYRFERPAAFWTAQIAVDVMIESMRVAVFALCVYWLTGLHRSAPAFLYFLAVLLLLYLCNVLMNRAIGCMCRTFESALRTASLVFVFYMITAGFVVQPSAQPSWLLWTHHLNPLGLAFSALMM